MIAFVLLWGQIEQAQTGLASLSLTQNAITQLRENFISIEKYVVTML